MRLLENSIARNIFDSLKESESIPSMKDKNFNETVLRDFRLFLMDKYGDEFYKDVTNEDVNEYFTGMFYDIWDNDDLDNANAAEDIIRTEYKITESASDRYQVREFDGPGAKFGVYDIKQKKFIQKGSKKVMIASCNELNKKANLNKELNESKSSKNKKKEKRVIMQQGNITCLKDGDKFYVYEDDNSNMSEYNNQDEAMRDALGRCGINPDNELKEPKK